MIPKEIEEGLISGVTRRTGLTTCVALLRGINVGGRKKVAMADLRELLAELGFAETTSLLQSGNLVFRTAEKVDAALEQHLEHEVGKRLGIETHFFLRTAKEWDAIIEKNFFPEAAERDPSHLAVVFLKDNPGESVVAGLRAAVTGPELIRGQGRQLYVFYPNGIGRSRLTNDLIERRLRTRATARNWNTVVKLAAIARSAPAVP
jgi:uncharacterized protein (DUF1697 family)